MYRWMRACIRLGNGRGRSGWTGRGRYIRRLFGVGRGRSGPALPFRGNGNDLRDELLDTGVNRTWLYRWRPARGRCWTWLYRWRPARRRNVLVRRHFIDGCVLLLALRMHNNVSNKVGKSLQTRCAGGYSQLSTNGWDKTSDKPG